MIVCLCNNVSDQEIRWAVDLGLTTMAELRRDLRVASDCGACADCACKVLTAHLESNLQAKDETLSSFVTIAYTGQAN